MGDLPPGKSPISKTRLMDSVCPAAVPAGVPTKSWPANHSDRSNNDRTGHHDHAFVSVATTIAATMFAAAATARGLGTNACEAQQGGECRNRKNFSAHYLGPLPGSCVCDRRPSQTIPSRPLCPSLDELYVNNCRARHGSLPVGVSATKMVSDSILESPEGEHILHRREMTRCATHGHASSSNRVGGKQRH